MRVQSTRHFFSHCKRTVDGHSIPTRILLSDSLGYCRPLERICGDIFYFCFFNSTIESATASISYFIPSILRIHIHVRFVSCCVQSFNLIGGRKLYKNRTSGCRIVIWHSYMICILLGLLVILLCSCDSIILHHVRHRWPYNSTYPAALEAIPSISCVYICVHAYVSLFTWHIHSHFHNASYRTRAHSKVIYDHTQSHIKLCLFVNTNSHTNTHELHCIHVISFV